MFLTQRLPWAVQRALREYGWMSVLGRLSNCKHLEAGGVRPMFTRAKSLHGGSSLLLHEQIKRWKQGPPHPPTPTHTPATAWTHTHIIHTTRGGSLSFRPFLPRLHGHTWSHTQPHTPPPLLLIRS